MIRLYFSGEVQDHGACRIEGGQAHHVMHVLRLATGDEVVLFDGRGTEYPARIERMERAVLTLQVSGRREANRDRKSTRLNSSHIPLSRMPSSA